MVNSSLVVVPRGARKNVLGVVHKAHLGRERTFYGAWEKYYWPTLREEVYKMLENCEAFSELASPRKPEREVVEKPLRGPMESVSCDVLTFGGRRFSSRWVISQVMSG